MRPALCLILSLLHTFTSSTPLLLLNSSSEFVLRDVFHDKDTCYDDSFVYVKQSEADEKAPFFRTFTTTKDCVARLKEEENLPSILPNCQPGLVDLSVNPVYHASARSSYPFANLNISVTAHSSVETLLFRFECLNASDGNDIYCSADFKSGKLEWPCRAIRLLSSQVRFPVRFAYSCFRLTPHSIYAVKATVFPQKCRLSTILTIPSFNDLFPEALVAPKDPKDLTSDPLWAPMISADLSDPTAIWIRLAKAEEARCERMLINVYKEYANDSQKVFFLETLEIRCPEDTARWENQLSGRYLLTAYVPIRGCKFICDAGDVACRQCLRSHLNLEIRENRSSFAWQTVQKMKDYSFEIFIGSLVILALLVLVMLAGLMIALYRRRKDAKRVREIQLTTYVKTMLIYADDNAEHTNCVQTLAECLRHCATCEPVLDVDQLIGVEQIVPSRWLVDQISELPKFLIVISACAEKILDRQASETHHLVQARPFADLFGPAMEMIIRDATHNSQEARKKYALVRFPYSPPIPPNLAVLDLLSFEMPGQFANLTAFLHDLEDVDRMNISQNLSRPKIDQWNEAVSAEYRFFAQHPNWLETRWRPKDEMITAAPMLQEHFGPLNKQIDSRYERIEAAEQYALIPPDDEDSDPDDVAAAPQKRDERAFMLYPPGDTTSDEDSEDSESD